MVHAEAVPNTDGGKYAWRCLHVELARSMPGHEARLGQVCPFLLQHIS